MVPFTSFRVTLFSLLASTAAAQQTPPGPREVVQSAERAVQDDSVAAVRARWTAGLRRDSTDRASALGLGSLARLTYDFATAERLFSGMLARAGGSVDPWTVQARIGLYRVANASGNTTRADSLLNAAMREARRIGDRGGELDALIGLPPMLIHTTRASGTCTFFGLTVRVPGPSHVMYCRGKEGLRRPPRSGTPEACARV